MNEYAQIGERLVSQAMSEMSGLQSILGDYESVKPFSGISFLVCVTPTAETAAFLITLHKLGATIAACSDNAYASNDDVVAYLQFMQIAIYAQSHMTTAEYFESMDRAINDIADEPCIHIVDDGCDITDYIVNNRPHIMRNVVFISEQTTCGINAINRLIARNAINVPIANINGCYTKQWFDNKIGIQQSLVHSLTAAGVSIPGKRVTVFGYGAVGQGAAIALRANGAHVYIVEKDIIKLMQAQLDGYLPISAERALQKSDICLTATGCIDTISSKAIEDHARSGIIFGNIGHGTSEYDVKYLQSLKNKDIVNDYMDKFTLLDGRVVYSLCQGALVNFLAGSGNMARIMSLTFTITILTHLYATKYRSQLTPGLFMPNSELERENAARNSKHLLQLVSKLTDEQTEYLHET